MSTEATDITEVSAGNPRLSFEISGKESNSVDERVAYLKKLIRNTASDPFTTFLHVPYSRAPIDVSGLKIHLPSANAVAVAAYIIIIGVELAIFINPLIAFMLLGLLLVGAADYFAPTAEQALQAALKVETAKKEALMKKPDQDVEKNMQFYRRSFCRAVSDFLKILLAKASLQKPPTKMMESSAEDSQEPFLRVAKINAEESQVPPPATTAEIIAEDSQAKMTESSAEKDAEIAKTFTKEQKDKIILSLVDKHFDARVYIKLTEKNPTFEIGTIALKKKARFSDLAVTNRDIEALEMQKNLLNMRDKLIIKSFKEMLEREGFRKEEWPVVE